MRKIIFGCLIFAMMVFVPGAQAAWIDWTAANNDGGEFWDNPSSDTEGVPPDNRANVGYWLTKTGVYANDPAYNPPGNLPFLANADGSAMEDVSLSGGPRSVSMKFEWSAYSNSNAFGWFEWGNIANKQQIFAGGQGAGAVTVIIPTATYGFYFETPEGNTWYSQGNGNHFALFKEGADTYWLGMEDLNLGDADYNDMIVRISAVPEPAVLLLLGLGLAGIAGVRRMFRK